MSVSTESKKIYQLKNVFEERKKERKKIDIDYLLHFKETVTKLTFVKVLKDTFSKDNEITIFIKNIVSNDNEIRI